MVTKSKNTGAKQAGDYLQTANIAGYIHNREITNLPGQYLVQGSQNTFIQNGEKVNSRMGYTLLGAAKTVNFGIHSSYDWLKISSGPKWSLRAYTMNLEVLYSGVWTNIFTLPNSNKMAFTTWWNATELIDVLIGVNGTSKIYEWSGAITTVANVSSNTITKQRYLSTADIAFFNNGVGISGTIVKSAGGFFIAGWQNGDTIVISGSAANSGTYIIQSITDTTITLNPSYILTNEVIGPTVTIQEQNGTWAGKRFLTVNAGDANNRQVRIGSVDYTYTSGEATGTLTGVTPSPLAASPAITVGATVSQTVRVYSPGDLVGISVDVIGMMMNQVFYGSTNSRICRFSKNTDFTSFALTSPLRVPGEGAVITLDSCPASFKEGPDNGTNTPTCYVGAGTDDIYRISFLQQISTDASGISHIYETTPVKRLPTSTGSAPLSQDACVDVKNATVYLSHEPTIDTLQNVTTLSSPKGLPISDPIKDDIESFDRTGVHGVYAKRALWYTFPREGKIMCFDYSNENHYWQPPQLITVSRLATIEIDGVIELCGHSQSSNETYILFKSGVLNDNGAKFKAVAMYGYENYGKRFMKKNFDEMAVEFYATATTVLNQGCNFDYKGSRGVKEFSIDATDTELSFIASGNSSEGSNPEGFAGEGTTTDEIPTVRKVKVINGLDPIDFYERQRYFWSDSVDCFFQILAYGENIMDSENLPTELER